MGASSSRVFALYQYLLIYYIHVCACERAWKNERTRERERAKVRESERDCFFERPFITDETRGEMKSNYPKPKTFSRRKQKKISQSNSLKQKVQQSVI